MLKESFSIPCSIIRGGTSKGVFFLEDSLPKDKEIRDKVILSAFGSPDTRQIDGLGGANPLTSKVCIIRPSNREDADVDYTYGQVGIDRGIIDWRGNCGNMISAVGIFAISHNLIETKEMMTTVRIYNTNSNKIIHVTYPIKDGQIISEGDYAIPGVPGTGAKLKVDFLDPAGSVTKKLLPTGNVKDYIKTKAKDIFEVSVIDSGNPVVFVKAESIGLRGTELPAEIESMKEKMSLLEELRGICAEITGIGKSPAYPKICIISASADYINSEGIIIKAEQVDLSARMASLQKMHSAFAVTGAICTGAAAKIKGTIVNETVSDRARNSNTIIIGQPYGPMEVTVEIKDDMIIKEGIYRTARKILDGVVYIPYSKIQ